MLIKERKPGNEVGGGGELERAIFHLYRLYFDILIFGL